MRIRTVFLSVGIIAALSGCGGNGDSSTATDVHGDWAGTFATDARLANATSGDLDVHYEQTGSHVSGVAILTVDTGGGNVSYQGTVTGTSTDRHVDATIHFSPALPGGTTDVDVSGTVNGTSFSGTYTTDDETGTITQNRFTTDAAIPNGSHWSGTYSLMGVETPIPFEFTFGNRQGTSLDGTVVVGGEINGTFDGTAVANRLVGTTDTPQGDANWSGDVDGNTITGTWAQIGGEGHGTFTVTRQLED